MNKFSKQSRVFLWVLLLVSLAACTQNTTPDLSIAGTYAAQTLAAIPTDTDVPEPDETTEPTSTPTETLTPKPEPLDEPVGPVNFPENVNPLTGMVVSDISNLDRRPVFVKVANYPASGRPHAGLSSADMVFEYFIGAGGNRFIGLFYGQNSDKIGPVRSGRLVDAQIVSLYEGVLGMEGAYVTVLDRITEVLGDRVISGRGTCPAICDDGRNIVISVFANSEAMTEVSSGQGVDNRRYTLEGMAFDPDVPQGDETAEQVSILFSSRNRGDWRFDEDSGKYLRWIEDDAGNPNNMIPLVDRNTEEQLEFSNVIVIFANHTELAPTLHEIDLWNVVGQPAVVFRDGKAFEGTWTTPTKSQPIQFLDEAGDIFPLKPGNSWVVIMGTSSGKTENDGQWIFEFRIP